ATFAPACTITATFASGSGSSTIKLFDAESLALSASVGGFSASTASFAVAPATAAALSVATPPTQTAGVPFTVTIAANDGYGNRATGYAGKKPLTWSGPSAAPNGRTPAYPTSVTFVAGVSSPSPSVTLFDAQTTALSV